MTRTDSNRKMILLGFDGASWNVLSPLVEQGKVPHIKSLMEKGVHAKLRTPHPNFTPIIWTSILSGVEAKRHGIKSFFNTRNDLLVPRLWDIMVNDGKSAGLVGHYFTYPLDEKLDFCIPSHFDRGIETQPADYQFVRELTHLFESKDYSISRLSACAMDALKHGLSFNTLIYALRSVSATVMNRSYFNSNYRFQRVFLDISFDAFMHAYHKYSPDFASFYSPLPDTICHKYWCFHESDHFDYISPDEIRKYGNVIDSTYMHIDRLIGRLLDTIPSTTQICIVSDHGFQRLESSRNRLVLVPDRLMQVLDLKKDITVTNLGHQILVQPSNNAGGLELLNSIAAILRESRMIDKDWPVFEDIVIGDNPENLYFRLYYKIEDINARIVVRDREMKMADIANVGSKWSGCHHMEEGIFLLSGEGVSCLGEQEMVDAVNITPTLLRLQGCSVAKDLNGTVMEDVINPQWAKHNRIKIVDSYEGILDQQSTGDQEADSEEVTKKLKSLGYM